MNRWEYTRSVLHQAENALCKQKAVRIYDGDDKTKFTNGELMLTSHRILWGHPGDISSGQTCLSLNLHYIFCVEEESAGTFGFGKNKKVVLHLSPPKSDKNPGPVMHSYFHHVKLSFKEGIDGPFIKILEEAVTAKIWEADPTEAMIISKKSQAGRVIQTRTGIVGIERSLEERKKATDESISVAFKDLNNLMSMAKEMVNISKTISAKIREKQGDITEDDTVRFKSYLMSLGIDDPVTRDAYKSESEFYKNLAQQISDILVGALTECGGMMTLADAWCRVNRARGLELISPEDLLNACKMLDSVDSCMCLRKFPSGACVLQLNTHDDNVIIKSTSEMLDSEGVLTAQELAQKVGISVLLAKERLITTESAGLACRDDSIEGLRFYPNLFLKNED